MIRDILAVEEPQIFSWQRYPHTRRKQDTSLIVTMDGSSWKDIFSLFSLVFVGLFHSVSSDLYVNQPGHIHFKQAQITSQYNVFEITFKTIDASGMLLYALSVEKGDYLTIELVRGKIRYAGEFGNAHINIDKQVTGYHHMFVGQDLADNQWHTVKVTQNTQDITIIIDGKREPRFFGFRRAPPAPTAFSIDEVYIGGLYSYIGLSEERSESQEGTSMCVRSAFMNGKSVLQGDVTRSNVLNFCQSINYYPIFFPNIVSHLAYKNYAEDSLRLAFDFRTVIPEQIVVNYTNSLTKVMDLTINREGRLVLGAYVENTGAHYVMKTATPKLNDGGWHSVEFFISNRAPDYEAEFTVDGVKRRSKFLNPFIFNGGPLHLGFGFTGCMKNFILNGKAVDYTKLQKVSVLMGKCNLKDFCTPNPCINGGKCNQTDTIFRCDCRHTPYKGSCCSESRFNYTCTEIHQKAGDRFRSDKYWLDMDGLGGLDPIRAFCRKGRTPEDTITQINTTIQYDMNVINPTGKKIIPITYLADEESFRELFLHVRHCRQFVRYRCARSALFRSPGGPKAVQWMGFDDKLHYYWGGSGGKRGYCACGITRTCNNPNMHCNCDSLRFVRDLEDRGYLTIKEHLPIRRLDYFDVMSENGKVGISSVGALQCWGVGIPDLAATFREPWSYLQIELTDENDWNCYIDAGDIMLEFLTTRATGVLVFAKGPISGDFMQIKLLGKTRARATMNLGYYKNLHLDVDIAITNRTFDDNLPHKLRLDFNRREMNFTVDNITRIVEFHYQYGITHLDVDGSPFYIGGRNDGLEEGFMGIIRGFYYGGKLVDMLLEAEGKSHLGVYPGQGSACVIVKSPCNQGFCIDEYNQFKCNCSVSAFSGSSCHLDENALVFQSGNYIAYNFQNKVQVEEAYINLAFKTKSPDGVIFQLRGLNNAHISLLLVQGSLKLLYNFHPAKKDVQSITFRHPLPLGQFNDDKRHIIRVHHKVNQIFTYVLDDNENPIEKFSNISAPFEIMPFPEPKKLSLGLRSNLLPGFPTSFIGCISGLRYQYLPMSAKKGVTIDPIRLFTTKNSNTGFSSPPPVNGSCGADLPVPPPLPPIIPPQQFRFRNPVITVAPIGTQFTFAKIVVVIIIIVLAILAIILFFVTISCVDKFKKKYRLKEQEYRLALKEHEATNGRPVTSPGEIENYRQLERQEQPHHDIPLQEIKKKPLPHSNDSVAHAPSSQPPYEAGNVSYVPRAPSPQPGYSAAAEAAAASSQDEQDEGDWFL